MYGHSPVDYWHSPWEIRLPFQPSTSRLSTTPMQHCSFTRYYSCTKIPTRSKAHPNHSRDRNMRWIGEPYPGAPLPPSYSYHIRLEVEGEDYTKSPEWTTSLSLKVSSESDVVVILDFRTRENSALTHGPQTRFQQEGATSLVWKLWNRNRNRWRTHKARPG